MKIESGISYHKICRMAGIFVVHNKSPNLKGKPMVTAPENAFNAIKINEMDILVLDNYFVVENNI